MPHITVITPTTPDRSEYMDRLHRMLQNQRFDDFEWLIDSGAGTIGEKRNRLCARAKGKYIAHCDSDDLYGPLWLVRSLNAIILSGANAVGLSSCYFASDTRAWLYEYKGSQPYIVGASMFYKREAWERHPFPHTSNGEDTLFCSTVGRIKPHREIEQFVASIHPGNTASQHALPYMAPIQRETVNFADTWYK